jgi:dTDP-4-amino-4,6-dideoxygalactose transaminase
MRKAVQMTLHSRFIGQGQRVDEFERAFEKYLGVDPARKAAVAVSSCTAALHLAYLLAGIKPGDRVISPLFTCTATNEALLYCGARPMFCDVEPGGLNISHDHIFSGMFAGVKAIVVVHYGGQPALKRFSASVPVIEDCAQALGGQYEPGGPMLGTLADYACYSFQAVKHLTTGDGGMLVCPRDRAEEAKRLRWFGIDRAAKLGGIWENNIREVGYKYQMTDIAASMGLAGLQDMEAQMTFRHCLRAEYIKQLKGADGITILDRSPSSAVWLMTVAVERDREGLMQRLKEANVESGQVHYRNDRYDILKEYAVPGGYPNMDAMESKYLVLPLHMKMNTGDVRRICRVIQEGW